MKQHPFVIFACSAVLVSARPAHAAPKDVVATKLADDAMNNDYLSTRFVEADKKLRRAIQACEPMACSPQVRARLHRDLGVVLIAGRNLPEQGKKEFAEALKADPNIALDKDLLTPEIQQAFQAARGAVSSRAKPSPQVSGATSGDLNHAPPAARSAPIYVEDKADCPPDFPGCTARKRSFGGNKGWGDGCAKDGECSEGLACKAGQCETGVKSEGDDAQGTGASCDSSVDCGTGETCSGEKICVARTAPRKRFWLTAGFAQDISAVDSRRDVCGTTSNPPGDNVLCFSDDGGDYVGAPEPGAPGSGTGNAIKAGPHLATTRLLAGIDYLIGANWLVGGRFGYALNVAPGRSLAAYHVEGRVGYVIGNDPFARQGLRPYAAVVGGLAEIDDKYTVEVRETLPADPNLGIKQPTQALTVWRTTGGYFAGLAAGVMYPMGSMQALVAELKAERLFPGTGVAFSPSLTYGLGF